MSIVGTTCVDCGCVNALAISGRPVDCPVCLLEKKLFLLREEVEVLNSLVFKLDRKLTKEDAT